MTELKRTKLKVSAERALLVRAGDIRDSAANGDPLEELRSLAGTAGVKVVGEMTQQRIRPHPIYYLGKGKLNELRNLCNHTGADTVICDDDLSPAQVKTLEVELQTKVVDRTELILDIFATHARTKQARLQVELAQLEYEFPRLKRMWSHLDRTAGGTLGGPAGGGVGVRGPGERQLEVDRRLVQRNIYELKKGLQKIERRRQLMVKNRNEQFPASVLIGYTNAGKSSLMNALTGANVRVGDRLFQTLDTRTRLWQMPDHRQIMLSDTVGFIRKLPYHLVASFHATLEEVREADLLLHVIDASTDDIEGEIAAVAEVLAQIGCAEKPRLPVLNKIDLLQDTSRLFPLRKDMPDYVTTSAVTGQGLDLLTEKVCAFLDRMQEEVVVETGIGNGRLISLLYESGVVLNRNYDGRTVRLRVRIPAELAGRITGMGGRLQRDLKDHSV